MLLLLNVVLVVLVWAKLAGERPPGKKAPYNIGLICPGHLREPCLLKRDRGSVDKQPKAFGVYFAKIC
jgi:hypothetical protein